MTSKKTRHSYVQMYVSDWIGGCASLPPSAEWVYLQICLYNWDKVKEVPKDEIDLILMREPNHKKWLSLLIKLTKVKVRKNGSLYVDRALAEGKRSLELWKKKSEGGKTKQKTKADKNDKKQGYTKQSSLDSSKTDGNSPPLEPEPEPEPEVKDRECKEDRESNTPPKSPTAKKYKFEGGIIRLKKDDFDLWKKRFHAIPDIVSELHGLDDWLGRQDGQAKKDWFVRVSAALNKKHQRFVQEQSGNSRQPGEGDVADPAYVPVVPL